MYFLANADLPCKVTSQAVYLCLKVEGNEGNFFLTSFGLALFSSISQIEYQVYNNHLEMEKENKKEHDALLD